MKHLKHLKGYQNTKVLHGDDCSIAICHGKKATNPQVCSGRGNCIDHNVCCYGRVATQPINLSQPEGFG